MTSKVRRIEVGDLIQLNNWFGDAWSEVTEAFEPDESGKQMFCHVRRDKYGTRGRDHLSFSNREGLGEKVRRVEKPENVDPFTNNINFRAHRVRYGDIWDAGTQIGRLSRA